MKNFLKKQKEGRITVAEAIKKLGISRGTWYNLAKEVS
jgi:ACT domain-containing protein